MKKLSFFLMAMLFSVMSFAAETVAYTLTTASTGTGNNHTGYASAVDYTTNGITWNVTGNSNMVPWRIGGKSITNVDRAVYTKTALAADVTKIEITHGTVNCTINSCTLTVSDAANEAGETFAVTVAQNTTSTITLPEGDYSNKYYKLVYNITVSGSSNKYVQLSEIKFYTEVQTSIEAPTFTPEEGKVAANNTFAEPFALTIASATEGATIKYTLDGTDPALETALTYESPITISTMVQVRAIAVKGEESSVEATATYIVASTEEKPYTASEAITAQSLGLAASVYVTGTVKTIEEISTQYGNATYNITDGVKELKIYRGKNLENAKFTSEDQLLVGDVVVVKGDLTSYNGAAQLGQNNYLISRIPAVVNYTVTVTANAEGENVVTGAGEYEEGEEVTVTASEDLEGWVFIGWTEDGEFVANDPEYTFVVKGDVELVAVYAMDLGENEVTDLVIDGDNMLLTGSVAGFPMGTMNLELALGEYDDEEDVFLLTEESKLYVGETNFTFVDGMAAVDMNTNSAMAIVVFEHNGAYYYMTVNMSAAAAKIEATVIEIDNATVTIEERSMGFGDEVYHVLKMESTWSDGETTYPVLLETTEFDQTKESQEVAASITVGGMGDEDPWLGNAEGDVTITVADGKVTVEGLLENAYAWPAPVAFDVTISGKLPVVEPTTITYDLNGGVLPAPAVPTNAELWGTDTADVNGLMHYFNHYYDLKRSAQDISAAVSTNPVATFLTGMPDDAGIFVDEESKYKWLGDYIVKVTNDQIAEGKLSVLTDVNTNIKWRYGVQAFFMCLPATDSNYKGWADFTEAGKPENWGPAYQAANALVLPTEPVAEDYTLPTPTKEGYTFVGWYDNAAGEGEAYKVIPAGWAGTLYAIWKTNGPTTDLDNIAIEGKAVKAIINGQLIIIKNGVKYNVAGAVVK